jgi:hypothetical protein
VNNLKQVGLSFRIWALDNNDKYPMQVSVANGGTMELIGTGQPFMHFQVMSNELSTPAVLHCPQEQDQRRVRATTFQQIVSPGSPYQITFGTSNLSYFIGVDASDTSPEMFLCGDRNLVIDRHATSGRIITLTTNSVAAWNKPPPHKDRGHIGLADGSVQAMTDHVLWRAIRTNSVPNRLEFP